MNAIIIEDQMPAHDYLKSLLNALFPEIKIVAHATNVEQAIKAIQTHNPQIVFSDVKLEDENSFSVFEKLENIQFKLIFTTAFDEFAVKAFKFSAIDYILKPIDPSELKTAVEKALEKIVLQNNTSLENKKINSLIQNIKTDTLHQIALPDSSGYKFVNINEITRCEADGNYTKFIFMDESSVLVCKTIKEYETLLKDSRFFRVHKTHLINFDHVKSYEKHSGFAVMKNGAKIAVARRRKDDFLSQFAIGE